MRKHVEVLILKCYSSNSRVPYSLPEFLFDNARNINCLSGSLSLELLEANANGGSGYVIASKSLKTLMLAELILDPDSEIEVLYPNLEKFCVQSSILPRKVIENVVSCCPLLTSLEVGAGFFEKLVIASKSLRNLVLRDVNESCAIEISCPKLEEFHFYDSFRGAFDWTKSNNPTQNWICPGDEAKKIFEPLQNVKMLTLGSWFIKILSDVEMAGLSFAWSNNKILTLHRPHFEHLPGIMCALRSSPALERLVIKLQVYKGETTANLLDLNASGENYLNSIGTVGNGLLSHLKTVEIIGLSKQDAKCKLVLNFIKFLLNNARLLEKFVLVISKDGGKDFALAVARKVWSFPRCSQHVIVELF